MEEAPIQPIGRAAKKVYQTCDIRAKIFGLSDQYTLTRLMRVDKAGAGDAIAALYKKVTVAQARQFCKKEPRCLIYRDAVRELDLSPTPKFPAGPPSHETTPEPDLCDVQEVHQTILKYRAVYPRLRTLSQMNPEEGWHPAWVCYLDGENITLHLRDNVRFNLYPRPLFPHPGPAMPPAPTHEKMTIHHTLAVHVVVTKETGKVNTDWMLSNPAVSDNSIKWRDWLYSGDIDPRVTAINADYDCGKVWFVPEQITIRFMEARKRNGCAPISKFELDRYRDGASLERFREDLIALGPHLQSLTISRTIIMKNDLQSVINILDELVPSLQELRLSGDGSFESMEIPLGVSGLPNLRKLAFHGDLKPVELAALSRRLWRIGSRECVFTQGWFHNWGDLYILNNRIHSLKSSNPFGAWEREEDESKRHPTMTY